MTRQIFLFATLVAASAAIAQAQQTPTVIVPMEQSKVYLTAIHKAEVITRSRDNFSIQFLAIEGEFITERHGCNYWSAPTGENLAMSSQFNVSDGSNSTILLSESYPANPWGACLEMFIPPATGTLKVEIPLFPYQQEIHIPGVPRDLSEDFSSDQSPSISHGEFTFTIQNNRITRVTPNANLSGMRNLLNISPTGIVTETTPAPRVTAPIATPEVSPQK